MSSGLNNNVNKLNSFALAKACVRVLSEKQGIDVKLYDVREKTAVTDFYLNVTGRSTSHVGSLADDLCEELEKSEIFADRIEGRGANNWLLVDYYDVVVNIFDRQSREFYSLDRLFGDDCLVNIDDIIAEVDEKFRVN